MRIAASAFILSALLAQLATAKTVTTTKTRSYRTVKLTAAQLDAELHARQAHATAYSNGVSVNTTIVGAWRQCAGKNWIAPCSTGTTCVARSDLYSECIPNEYVVRHADGRWVFKHSEPVVEVEVDVDYVVSEVGEWEQCLWEDRRVACAPGLHCAELHPWFGQCVANDEHHVHNREHVVRRWVEDEDVVVHHHHRDGRAAQWEQCKWEHDEIECAPGLQCAVQSKFFGQCVKRDALLWEQCGGLNWAASCELGSTCVKRDDVYSQCVPIAAEEYVNHEHHHHHHHHHHNHHVHHHEAPKPKPPVIEIAKEWEQCKWDDKLIDCAAGLQCAIRNDWFGQCVRTAAVAWEQCGGSFWTATCSAGNTCVKRDEHYSQCVPNDRLDHHLHHKRERIVHTTEHVHRHHPKIVETVAFWEQCAGIDWSSTCAAGSTCVKRDARFGQCIPHDHLATHRHFSWHGDHTHWVDDEPEVVVVVESEAQLWDQCLWRGRQLECAAGLQCAAQSEWFGQCVPTVAAVGEQCGGQFWTAVCTAGSKCVERDALYSHCVPVTHHHHHHRRADEFVVHREPVAARVAVAKEFEQCKWEDARVDCAAGLRCVVHNQWFGQCVRAVAAAGEQCSGLHWTAPCAAGSTCVQRDEHFGECVPTATTTRHAPHHHHEEVRHYHDSHHHVDHHHDHRRHGHWVYEVEVDAVPVVHTRAKAGEFEQCKWENDEVECAAGLQCAVESDWFGQCVKREAELWGQCGGRHWLAACPVGSKCVHRRDDFKQCLPVA